MVWKLGHRGAMGYEPENTLRSFKKALKMKVDFIELDVHVCKSGEVVIIHDNKVDRTTNGRGRVAFKTLSELRSLDAGKKEKIPTLREALDLINKKTKVNIELKGEGTAYPVYKIIREYIKRKGWAYDHFLISSFNRHELNDFYRLNKKIKRGLLISKWLSLRIHFASHMECYSVHLDKDLITKKYVHYIHQKGLKVFAWTTNSQQDLKRLKLLGVDGLISDFPDRI
ncbi:MAG: glycerophosphodiester phosphodiesterase family protein [Nanoarchaeota archaeon]|nr:glycerophosphodiester phosphodiesterase family protein [Nanoarchaeota archaeon]